MKQLSICPECSGYVPESTPCPHCEVAPPRDSRAMRLLKSSLKFVGAGAMTVTIAACYGAPVSNETIETIEVSGGNAVVVGSNLQLAATATLADGSTLDVTLSAVWTTNSAGVATVTSGVVIGQSPGAAEITATQDGVSGVSNVTVSATASSAVSADLRKPLDEYELGDGPG